MIIRPLVPPRTWRRIALASVLLAPTASGCGPDPDGVRTHVWGRVLCQGKPLTSGTVVLRPLSGQAATWGAGALDEDGRFQIIASRLDLPLEAGRYAVYIRPPTAADPVTGAIRPPDGYLAPARYLDPESHALVIDIKDEPTKLEFDLRD